MHYQASAPSPKHTHPKGSRSRTWKRTGWGTEGRRLTASCSPSQTHSSSCSSAHTPGSLQAPVHGPNSQSASRSGTRGRIAAAAACQVGGRGTLSVAAHTTAPAARAAVAVIAAGRAWGEGIVVAAGIAEGIAAGIVAAGIARWGLGGRREAWLRRLCRAIGGIAAWAL